MPVSVLVCEGQSKSPDIRLLRSILTGIACEIKPGGGKYGFGTRILAFREANPQSVIMGIIDRDFDDDVHLPVSRPREWTSDDGKIFGWRWERCEVENYLIDPRIVEQTLGRRISHQAYETALNEAVRLIGVYTAARTALSIARRRFSPLANAWGHEGQLDHKFPERFEEADCRQGILQVLQEYDECQMITAKEVFAHFEAQLPVCQQDGTRFQHFLTFFSGKDLMLAMRPALQRFGFTSPKIFRESILYALENSAEDIWEWLPEWAALRQLIL
jgi:hypothetical protein